MSKPTDNPIAVHCAHDRLVDVTELVPNPRNPNRHPDKQIALLAKIIRHQGWRAPVVVSKRSGLIVAGHGRFQAAKLLGIQAVPVNFQEFACEADEWAHVIADNRIAELAETDGAALKDLLIDLDSATQDFDMDLSGFDKDELERVINSYHEEPKNGEASEAEATALQKKWGTDRGQLWEVGSHRILCGDCKSEADVARVMRGEKWDVAIIDPPFELDELPHLSDPSIVFGQAKHIRMIPDALFRFERVIDKVQAHRSATVNIGHRHAFVVQCGTVKTLPNSSETFPSIVVCESRPDHPHQKDAWLLREHLTMWTPDWKIAFDPFCGSGTTLIVCEQMKRAGRGIEQSPAHCAVILERMSALSPGIRIELESSVAGATIRSSRDNAAHPARERNHTGNRRKPGAAKKE